MQLCFRSDLRMKGTAKASSMNNKGPRLSLTKVLFQNN